MLYEASSEGRIRTCDGKVTSNALHKHRVWKQRILKQKCITHGRGRTDYRVSLWKDGVEKTWLVSRLVALAFCEGYSEGMTVNHIDGNPMNNKASNLEWCSIGDNIRKGFEIGLYSTQRQVSIIYPNGESKDFASIADANRFLGKGKSYLSTRMCRNQFVLPDGCVLKVS